MVKSVSLVSANSQKYIKQKPRYAYARDLIHSSGVFTQEDSVRLSSIKQELSLFSQETLKNKLIESSQNITKFFQGIFNDTILFSGYLLYNSSENLSNKNLKSLKSQRLFQYALLDLVHNTQSRKLVLPPSDIECVIFEECKKVLPISTKDSLLVHPIEIAENIVGSKKRGQIGEKYNLYKNSNIKDVLIERNKILEQVSAIVKLKGSVQNFVYSDADIKFLRGLLLKFYKLDQILKAKNINVKNIETLLYSPLLSKSPKIGDILFNSDVVFEKTMVWDKKEKRSVNAMVTFANTNSGYRLKLYRDDDRFISNALEILNKYKWYQDNSLFDKINSLDKKCIEVVQASEVAEVFFQENDKQSMADILLNDKLVSREKVEEILSPQESYMFVRNLKNYDSARYHNVALPLIKALRVICERNKLGDAFLNAYAYNNVKHSPAALYLYAGCEPISHTVEEVRELLKREDKAYKQPILFMYHCSIKD